MVALERGARLLEQLELGLAVAERAAPPRRVEQIEHLRERAAVLGVVALEHLVHDDAEALVDASARSGCAGRARTCSAAGSCGRSRCPRPTAPAPPPLRGRNGPSECSSRASDDRLLRRAALVALAGEQHLVERRGLEDLALQRRRGGEQARVDVGQRLRGALARRGAAAAPRASAARGSGRPRGRCRGRCPGAARRGARRSARRSSSTSSRSSLRALSRLRRVGSSQRRDRRGARPALSGHRRSPRWRGELARAGAAGAARRSRRRARAGARGSRAARPRPRASSSARRASPRRSISRVEEHVGRDARRARRRRCGAARRSAGCARAPRAGPAATRSRRRARATRSSLRRRATWITRARSTWRSSIGGRASARTTAAASCGSTSRRIQASTSRTSARLRKPPPSQLARGGSCGGAGAISRPDTDPRIRASGRRPRRSSGGPAAGYALGVDVIDWGAAQRDRRADRRLAAVRRRAPRGVRAARARLRAAASATYSGLRAARRAAAAGARRPPRVDRRQPAHACARCWRR